MPLRKEEPNRLPFIYGSTLLEHYAQIHFTIESCIQQGCGCGKIMMPQSDCNLRLFRKEISMIKILFVCHGSTVGCKDKAA